MLDDVAGRDDVELTVGQLRFLPGGDDDLHAVLVSCVGCEILAWLDAQHLVSVLLRERQECPEPEPKSRMRDPGFSAGAMKAIRASASRAVRLRCVRGGVFP